MEEVTELQPVPDAHVPVMKFKFRGLPIDLLYASVSLPVIPPVSFHFLGFRTWTEMHAMHNTRLRWCFMIA